MKSVLEGTNYARSLKLILILVHAIESFKWEVFMENTDTTKYAGFLSNINKLQETLSKKDRNFSQDLYCVCADSSEELKLDLETFNKASFDKSEMCRYWDGVIILTSKLKNLIATDCEGNWEAHLRAIQDLLPIFCKSESFNYQRYGSIYLEFMQKLPKDHPLIHRHFKEGKSAVKTSIGYVGADIKLEQTIQHSKKGSGGVRGQAIQEVFVTEWELAYHELIAISKCHKDITGSLLANSKADLPHCELTTRSIAEYNEAVNKVITFMKEKGSPYITSANTKLHHFTSGQLVSISPSDKLINYFDHGQAEYEIFRRESYHKGEKARRYYNIC